MLYSKDAIFLPQQAIRRQQTHPRNSHQLLKIHELHGCSAQDQTAGQITIRILQTC